MVSLRRSSTASSISASIVSLVRQLDLAMDARHKGIAVAIVVLVCIQILLVELFLNIGHIAVDSHLLLQIDLIIEHLFVGLLLLLLDAVFQLLIVLVVRILQLRLNQVKTLNLFL